MQCVVTPSRPFRARLPHLVAQYPHFYSPVRLMSLQFAPSRPHTTTCGLTADDVHVHIHFSHPDAAAPPYPAAPGAAGAPGAGPAMCMPPCMPPFQPEEVSAASQWHADARPPPWAQAAWPRWPDGRVPGPGTGLPAPMQLPLQPLTRLVAFDDSLADLVSEVDTLLESRSGYACSERAALRELPGWGFGGPVHGDQVYGEEQEGLGAQRVKEWVSGQTGACMAARVTRGPPHQQARAAVGADKPMGRAAAGPAGGRAVGVHVAGAPRRRQGSVETQTAHPAGRRLECATEPAATNAGATSRRIGSTIDAPLARGCSGPGPEGRCGGDGGHAPSEPPDGDARPTAGAPVATCHGPRGSRHSGSGWGRDADTGKHMHDVYACRGEVTVGRAHARMGVVERGVASGGQGGVASPYGGGVAWGCAAVMDGAGYGDREVPGRSHVCGNVDAQDVAIVNMLNECFGE